jgi:hypothetical protein
MSRFRDTRPKRRGLYVTYNPGKSQIQKSITLKANGYVQVDFDIP